MFFIGQLIKFIKTFHFGNPKKADIVIFDKVSGDVIIKTILQDMPYVILPAHGEFIYISPQILFSYIINIFRRINLIEMRLNQSDINSYFLPCLKIIEPKIVITFIDNSSTFNDLSENYRNAEFIAIQNGSRGTDNLVDSLPLINGKKIRYNLSHFVCFGQNEVDIYKKFEHTIIHAYPVGSLKAGYYRERIDIKKVQWHYNICLISQYRESIMEGTSYPEIKRGLLILFDFLKRFVQENGVKFCIAMCPADTEKQRRFYQNFFGDQVELIQQKPSSYFSSYEAMDSSTLSLTQDSTLGLEAFGFGKKVLFCNFTEDDRYNINCPDLCKITTIDYNLFSQKLKNLLLMDQKEYLEQTETDRKYLMNYNPDFPAHLVVRQLIEKYL